ncbi:HNH endonuclease family protein [Actinacidiphila glaucinigra]|uniref:HNH endonuclease family protein n=1 Tax=Actinacidiphila glaucinigra TaxID=235986 RepID=UPI003F4C3318
MRTKSRARLLVTLAAGLTLAGSMAILQTSAAGADGIPLREAIRALPVIGEDRLGYERTAFRHWIDADRDRCSTRSEVLLTEAVTPPAVGAGCALTGGRWYSYYDATYVDGPSGLDIDHVVPLAEAWDSGASQWTPAQRQAYANDLDEPRALVAVTARSNRSKSDKDVAEWLPPHAAARCGYLVDWVTVKTRWHLAVDDIERDALVREAAVCPDLPIVTTPADTPLPS